MASPIKLVAAQLVTDLTAASFSLPKTVTRYYKPERSPEELAGLTLSIVPSAQEISNLTRTETERLVAVDVGIQKVVADAANATLDPLLDFVEEVAAFLIRRDLATSPTSRWVRIKHAPIYVPEHLDVVRVFTSVLTTFYKVRT